MSGVAADPLAVANVSVNFGGLAALVDVSLRVGPGDVVGLIGPNGAGKTTLFNTVTGLVRPSAGRVSLFGQDVTSWPPYRRVRLGVGRTFQRLELFSTLSVRENLVVAIESRRRRGGMFSDMLALPPSVETRAEAVEEADRILGRLGIAHLAESRAGTLPLGLSRLVELGRALCTGPRLLLLDEPSSGLRARESQALAALLTELRAEEGLSMLVVEHDMPFVLGLCGYVYVLEFGRLLAQGTPAEIRADPAVQAAYLGEEVDDAAAPARG